MPLVDLNENKEIAYFLVDDKEIGKGMYIASAYENFIKWQNNFLDSLIEHLKKRGILHSYVKNMEKPINVQNATKNEVLNFDEINDNFNLLIYQNCKRNIFKNVDTVNYLNYKNFIYDFDSIEKRLGEILLPGKVKFESIEKLKFVTFYFEGFKKNKSSIIIDFTDKYTQIPLSLEKKQIISDFIQDNYNEQFKALKILFSIQILISYLTQIKQNEKIEIKTILALLPENIVLSNECNEFFKNEKIFIKIEELIGVYSFIEFLCYEPIIHNLQEDYKKTIDEEVKKKILNLFDDKKFKIITKNNLAYACRIFISRYLIGLRNNDDFDADADLTNQLTRYEFWPKEIFENSEEEFNRELNYLKEMKITIGQCFELYNLIGGDKEEKLIGIKKKIVVNENSDNENY